MRVAKVVAVPTLPAPSSPWAHDNRKQWTTPQKWGHPSCAGAPGVLEFWLLAAAWDAGLNSVQLLLMPPILIALTHSTSLCSAPFRSASPSLDGLGLAPTPLFSALSSSTTWILCFDSFSLASCPVVVSQRKKEWMDSSGRGQGPQGWCWQPCCWEREAKTVHLLEMIRLQKVFNVTLVRELFTFAPEKGELTFLFKRLFTGAGWGEAWWA